MSDPALSHSYGFKYAAHLAQQHPAQLIQLATQDKAQEAKAIALRERVDLVIIGFTLLSGLTDE